MAEHQWKIIFSEKLNELYNDSCDIQWCPRCGTVKTGPFSEPGAYNYYCYYGVGPEDKYTGPPWNKEGFGYPYDEAKKDPPCGKWTVDENDKVIAQS